MSTKTKQHIWVKHTITPVSIIQGEDGQPIIFVDPQQQHIAEDGAAYGCNVCSMPLYPNNFNTECEGDAA